MEKKKKYKFISDFNFKDIDKFAVILAHSDSCPNCEVALKFMPLQHETATIYLLDFDIEEELCETLDVVQVPHLLYLYDGKVVGNLWGFQEPFTVTAWMNFHSEKLLQKEKIKDEKNKN
jgi:hypothetical protein